MKHAGSDSDFYYTIIGSNGETIEYDADNDGDDRKRGNEETWTFDDDTDIGKFRCIFIKMDGRQGWYFKKVFLKSEPSVLNLAFKN